LSNALIDKLSEEIFGMIERDVVFLAVVVCGFELSFEVGVGAHYGDESFVFEGFFEAVEVTLAEIGYFLSDEDH
jgi:hypothetical protein